MALATPSRPTWTTASAGGASDVATPSPAIPADDADQRFVDVRVLLVDDQQLNQEVASELLVRRGVLVDLAENGRRAIDILAAGGSGHYDLVLMDIEMPVLDGLSATRLIRSRREFDALPVVALTAHLVDAARDQYAAAGLDDQLGKPFTPQDLYAKVAQWVSPNKQVPLQAAGAAAGGETRAAAREFDWANALARFGNRQDRLNHWLRYFVAERRHAGQEILARIDNDDPVGAGKIAHALKGVSGTLGLLRLHQASSALEADLSNGRRRSPAMVAMQTALARAIAHIEQHLHNETAAAATSTPSAAGDREARLAALRTGLATLRDLLAAGDGASDEQAERCLSLAAGLACEEAVRQLVSPIRSFDFATALQILDRVAAATDPSADEGKP